MIHYELFFLYIAGFRAKDVIKDFGYSRKRAQEVIQARDSVVPDREKILNRVD